MWMLSHKRISQLIFLQSNARNVRDQVMGRARCAQTFKER